MKIYVGNLNYNTNEDTLHNAFSEFGNVLSSRVMIDKFTQRSRGFAFVEMDNDSEAQTAIDRLNGSSLDGRNIVVNEAKQREERGDSGFNRGGGGGNRGGYGGSRNNNRY